MNLEPGTAELQRDARSSRLASPVPQD